ncbi:fucose permease [Microbacteriaceae bacterium SG_E_30_P1]|uniref:Fucose permease n=1 Tax=Antiquaquibacter oligotrophicus TaxID=2880260 RepID=A0ABT6KQM7_9MICO|nr:MFS transporter [Antiquaquibacter oligotrophicus]MDH6182279.1 fucose permease [Antiquaquibacter oligotrophicus]UDF12064.1 MFS transporter [Antiquaquibacter oligotrophicus]
MTSTFARPQLLAWRNATFAVFALAGIALASWVSRLPSVRDALGIELDQVGILMFGLASGSIVGLLFSSHLIARFGARASVLAGLIVVSTGITVAGIGAQFGIFAVAWIGLFVFGSAAGITDVAMNVSGAANERALGKAIMPIFHAFFSFGTMIGAAVGALAAAVALPVAIHMAIVAAIMVTVTLVSYRFLQNDSGEAESSAEDDSSLTWRGRLSIWRDPRTILIGLVVLAAAFAEGSANDWLTIAMVDGHHVTEASGALVFGVFVTAMTAGRLGGVVLLNRFGRVPVLRASFLVAGLGLLVVIIVPDPIIATIGAAAWGLGSALGFPIGMSAAADDPKTAAARVSAVATIGYLAFLAGPPLIGVLGQNVGILNALLVVLVLCVAGGIVASAARERADATTSTDTFADPNLPR